MLGKANQIVSYFQKGCTHYNVLSLVEPKNQQIYINIEDSQPTLLKLTCFDQSGYPCSEKFTRYVDVLVA